MEAALPAIIALLLTPVVGPVRLKFPPPPVPSKVKPAAVVTVPVPVWVTFPPELISVRPPSAPVVFVAAPTMMSLVAIRRSSPLPEAVADVLSVPLKVIPVPVARVLV